MDRASLTSSTRFPFHDAPTSGLLDAAGAPIPSTRPSIDIRTLPKIDPDALPPLPRGIEARLLIPASGALPEIVLWSPVHAVSICIPLTEKEAVTEAAATLSRAIGVALRS